ncbi:MAG: PAS domain-containing protein [Janthinobacterium lividum]
MHTIDSVKGEQLRITALRQLEILDTSPEPEFDELVEIAAAICGTPIGLVSFVDEQRQWFKASIGLDCTETRREVAFCDHTIRQSGLLLIEDATQDSRFADNPLVTGDAGLRFYAGISISNPSGQPVGTLCVLDRVPRTLTPEQRSALRILANQMNTRLELRLQRLELQQALANAEAAKAQLTASERRFQIFMDSVPSLSFMKDGEGRYVYYNQPMATQFEVSREYLLNKTDAELWPAALASNYRMHDLAVLQSGELQVTEEATNNPDGSQSVWRSYKFPCPDPEGRPLLGCIAVEVTADLRREAELQQY